VSLSFFYAHSGEVLCRNDQGLCFYLLGQPPVPARPAARPARTPAVPPTERVTVTDLWRSQQAAGKSA
jgi:hypothetical protein